MALSKEELASLKVEYEAALEEHIGWMVPECRPLHTIVFRSFHEWLAERGIEPPEHDPTDPYTTARLSQYLAFRESELPQEPRLRALHEANFPTFDRWLHEEEVSERFNLK